MKNYKYCVFVKILKKDTKILKKHLTKGNLSDIISYNKAKPMIKSSNLT